jgi:hypothetical protein
MPKIRSRLIAFLALSLVSLFLNSNLNAQRSGIDTYAIKNARIVTVSGPVIERGTIVIRNGLIAAAGANVNAPPDARVIDGTGLTVYPGLIDSYTNLALPEASPGPSPAGAGGFFAAPPPRREGGPNSTQPVGLSKTLFVPVALTSNLRETSASQPYSLRRTQVSGWASRL